MYLMTKPAVTQTDLNRNLFHFTLGFVSVVTSPRKLYVITAEATALSCLTNEKPRLALNLS